MVSMIGYWRIIMASCLLAGWSVQFLYLVVRLYHPLNKSPKGDLQREREMWVSFLWRYRAMIWISKRALLQELQQMVFSWRRETTTLRLRCGLSCFHRHFTWVGKSSIWCWVDGVKRLRLNLALNPRRHLVTCFDTCSSSCLNESGLPTLWKSMAIMKRSLTGQGTPASSSLRQLDFADMWDLLKPVAVTPSSSSSVLRIPFVLTSTPCFSCTFSKVKGSCNGTLFCHFLEERGPVMWHYFATSFVGHSALLLLFLTRQLDTDHSGGVNMWGSSFGDIELEPGGDIHHRLFSELLF